MICNASISAASATATTAERDNASEGFKAQSCRAPRAIGLRRYADFSKFRSAISLQ